MNIVEEIQKLKKEKNAVILAHNYQIGEVQDVADFTGDSLGLSIQASRTDADIIIFCGVYFMAETAKIIAPDKTVLIPEKTAGCPMADMIDAKKLKALKSKHPNAVTICYVNSTAEVKAECDYCCTSGNALKMVKKIAKENKEIIFVPDQYLGGYVASQTGIDIIKWDGFCPTHKRITTEILQKQKDLHPNAVVVVHPECRGEVCDMADAVMSTQGMCDYVKSTDKKEVIVGTEIDMLHRLKKENPDKVFIPAFEDAVCSNMKKTTLENLLSALKETKYKVELSDEIIKKAKRSINRMLEVV